MNQSIEKIKFKQRVWPWLSEILKWGLVIWLVWPLALMHGGRFQLPRVLLGIVLFVIFTGKRFYDIVINTYAKNRNKSLKQDILGFIGSILVAALFVGFILFMFALVIVLFYQSSQQVSEP